MRCLRVESEDARDHRWVVKYPDFDLFYDLRPLLMGELFIKLIDFLSKLYFQIWSESKFSEFYKIS